MLQIYCPHCCETRHEQDFAYIDEAFITRPKDMATVSDQKLADYLYFRQNHKGDVYEQWQHVSGCRKILVVFRNNITNQIHKTYTLDQASLLNNSTVDSEETYAAI